MKYFISDSHTDFMTAIKSKILRENYIKECTKNGVKVLGCAIFTTEYNFSTEDVKIFKCELEELSKRYDIKLLLSIEDLGFVTTLKDLTKLIELNPFSISLTWNDLNQYAGGANTNQGITALGKRVVKLLEQNNILVDTAHLSGKSFDDFVKITSLPIYNSHSNIYELYPHKRNLSDGRIYEIVQSGGYLGLTIYNKFISNQQIASDDITNQFNYLINRFGVNNFGFGSDLYGFDLDCCPTDVKGYEDFTKVVEGFDKLGYNKNEISNVMCNNFKQFCLRFKN